MLIAMLDASSRRSPRRSCRGDLIVAVAILAARAGLEASTGLLQVELTSLRGMRSRGEDVALQKKFPPESSVTSSGSPDEVT